MFHNSTPLPVARQGGIGRSLRLLGVGCALILSGCATSMAPRGPAYQTAAVAESDNPNASCTFAQRMQKHGLVGELFGLPCTQESMASIGTTAYTPLWSFRSYRTPKYETHFHYDRHGRIKSMTTKRR